MQDSYAVLLAESQKNAHIDLDLQSTGMPLVNEAINKLSLQYAEAREEYMAKRLPMDQAQQIVAGHKRKFSALKRVRRKSEMNRRGSL